MKLVSFVAADGPGYGVAKGDGVVQLGRRLGPDYPRSLRALLAAGGLDGVAAYAKGRKPDLAWDDLRFAPVIPDPGKIVCIGLNYRDHVLETGRTETVHPALFARFAESQVGHEQPLVRPRVSREFDYEGELAVIIGTGGRHIAEANALSHVAGYSCYNDGSVRDWQRHTSQFLSGKTFAGTGGFGPWLVTTDEIPDPTKLTLETRLNGRSVQRSTTDLLITPIPALIAYLSTILPLAPGDVIATGTPGGVGLKRNPPLFMEPGDVVEVEIGSIGILKNAVLDEAA